VAIVVAGWMWWRVDPDASLAPKSAKTSGDMAAVSQSTPSHDAADEKSDSVEQTSQTVPMTPEEIAAAESAANDLARRQSLQGVWEDDFHGKRTFTLRPDGVASMKVELSGMASRLITKQLDFDIDWSLEGDVLTVTMRGGRPAGKVKLIRKLWGSTARYRIVDLSDSALKLIDLADNAEYHWRRLSREIPPVEPDEPEEMPDVVEVGDPSTPREHEPVSEPVDRSEVDRSEEAGDLNQPREDSE
jgi:hypothetical protein